MKWFCYQCGADADIDALDGFPTLTLRLWLVRLLFGQRRMLSYAGDHGHNFNRLHCSKCYGPGYEVGP